ncbi:unnamed protein product [Ostreobium quekettii]|uniref:Uncharacterized protein n=1 Tax=Ostreobium quekettii TaxID=121088 RepID=A0A8S1J1N0_9CHLO|nr:unnamed protein product [Ostreobium quekettii]|eukprot:evm.model.scf_460.5 EVM.evm.TU.scf_460.5   scf_460:63706-65528(-)
MVAHIFGAGGRALMRRGAAGDAVEWWRRRAGEGGRAQSEWERLLCAWDGRWHGTSEACTSGAEDADSCCSEDGSVGHCRSEDGSVASTVAHSVASTASLSSKRLMNKVISWIRERQDARRGIIYTKSGPCSLLEGLPIPPYPEDYDWCAN